MQESDVLADTLRTVSETLYSASTAAGCKPALLVAVSKLQPAAAIAVLAAAGQRDFGENYVQEALQKQQALRSETASSQVCWHLIGHLQSGKARDAATAFDWVQTVDRPSIAVALDRHRPPESNPLNVLLQVNIDGEPGKQGCRPDAVGALAATVEGLPRLRLRGLMIIPTPCPDLEARRPAFRAAHQLFHELRELHPGMDTLSMGMSDDYLLAIGEGATMVRVGSALFGARGTPELAG